MQALFSCEFYEVFKNNLFTEHLRASVSEPQKSWSNANITKNIIICGNISLVLTLWSDLFFAYIALKPISTFIRQFYSGDLVNFAGSAIIFFFIALLINQWFNQIAAMNLAAPSPVVFLHWQSYLIVSFYLFVPLQLFRSYLTVTNLSVPRSLRHLRFLVKLFSCGFSKSIRSSMGNSYCKKDYKLRWSKSSRYYLRLQKMKKNVTMPSFYCSVSKLWKKNPVFYVVKNNLFLMRNKLAKHFYAVS